MFTDLRQYQALQEVNDGYWIDEQGVLHGPKANWAPIPENATQPSIIPRMNILHTNAGTRPATWQELRTYQAGTNDGGVECHFDVDNNGDIGQFVSVFVKADCNFNANRWLYNGQYYGAISIETGDLGVATLEQTPWNIDQLHSMICILTCSATQLNTGCGEVLQWDGAGIDYHTKFPYYGEGIKAWTDKRGKTCPGTPRKRQVPWIRQAVADKVVAYINRCNELGVAHGIPGL